MRVICQQVRDGVPDDYVVEIPPLEGEKYLARYDTGEVVGVTYGDVSMTPVETPEQTLKRKLAGAEYHDWQVERISETEFHAWKEYSDGDGTIDAPHRKDRYFRIVE